MGTVARLQPFSELVAIQEGDEYAGSVSRG